MTRSTKIFTTLLVIETSLAGLWSWLVAGILSGDLRTSVPVERAITTISATMGGAMSSIAILALVLWLAGRSRHKAG